MPPETPEPSFEDIDKALGRIGLEDDEFPPVVLPDAVSLADLLDRLRAIPTGAGVEAFEDLMSSLPWPKPAPCDKWPDPGERFSLEDYTATLRLINCTTPEANAEEYATPPRQVPTWLFALLSLTFPQTGLRHRR